MNSYCQVKDLTSHSYKTNNAHKFTSTFTRILFSFFFLVTFNVYSWFLCITWGGGGGGGGGDSQSYDIIPSWGLRIGEIYVSVCKFCSPLLSQKISYIKKGTGTNLKPFIVFAGAKREVKSLQQEFKNQCSVASSSNGWMNSDLTQRWFSFQQKLVAWGSYEAQLTDNVKRCLVQARCEQAIVLGGCIKYVQAPDVV